MTTRARAEIQSPPLFWQNYMFIDQLGMIQEKTRGNLTNEETAVLRNTLSNLQMAFVEVSQQSRGETPAASPQAESPSPAVEPSAAAAQPEPSSAPVTPPAETESRKKFTKSYGA